MREKNLMRLKNSVKKLRAALYLIDYCDSIASLTDGELRHINNRLIPKIDYVARQMNFDVYRMLTRVPDYVKGEILLKCSIKSIND